MHSLSLPVSASLSPLRAAGSYFLLTVWPRPAPAATTLYAKSQELPQEHPSNPHLQLSVQVTLHILSVVLKYGGDFFGHLS